MRYHNLRCVPRAIAIALLFVGPLWATDSTPNNDVKIEGLIDRGQYSEAEKLLSAQIDDPKAPVTSGPAVQLEVLRRTRRDFPHTKDDVLA